MLSSLGLAIGSEREGREARDKGDKRGKYDMFANGTRGAIADRFYHRALFTATTVLAALGAFRNRSKSGGTGTV